MLNKVVIMGRLTKEPELRTTQSGVAVASFTLAVDRGFKKDETDFINIVAWRGTAEFVAKWFTKGQLVAASGRLQTRTYEDSNGNKRTATEVVADECFFAESKRNGAEGTYDMGKKTTANEDDFETVGGDEPLPWEF